MWSADQNRPFPGRHTAAVSRRPLSGSSGRFMRVLSADYDHRWPIGHHTPLSAGRKYGGGGGGRSPAADKQPARFINTAAGHNLDAARLMEGAAAEFTTSPPGSARRCGDSVRNSGGSSDCGGWWGLNSVAHVRPPHHCTVGGARSPLPLPDQPGFVLIAAAAHRLALF